MKRSVLLPETTALILATALGACSTPSRSKAGDNTHSPLKLAISVERSKTQDRWTVTYSANSPVSELVFDRQVNRFRAANWISKSPGVDIREIDGKETITVQGGGHFTTATFELASYYESTPKDYEFFQAFSDQSLVMYTGHYNACPQDWSCAEPVEFRFQGRPTDNVIVLGDVSTETQTWVDQTHRGTYIYFGRIKPLERKHLTAIIDPALPNWLEKRFHETLPKLFDFYTKQTGYALPFKPFVFLNYSTAGEGAHSGGGTLPGLIQLSLSGKAWAKEDKEAFIDLARFLAHEAAHVWNGQLFPYVSGDMWMHEGGADAFAYLALLKLGIVDRSGFLDLQTSAFNHCIEQLKNRPLKEVNEDPNFRSHYSCGSIVALITHAALKRIDHSNDLFTFWNRLFAKTQSNSLGVYTEDTYFSTLLEMTGDEKLVSGLNAFINGPTNRSAAWIRSELERQGVQFVSLESHPPKDYQRKQVMNLVRMLMRQDCTNRYSVSASSAGIETEPLEECRVFTKNFLITHIGTHSIKDGTAAYDSVYRICRNSDATIEFRAKGEAKPVKTDCPKNMPKREPAFGLSSIPI